MARDDEEPSVDARVNRSVRRFLTIVVLVLVLLAASAGWAYTGFPGAEYLGFYQLKPGQSAIILRLGAYSRTELFTLASVEGSSSSRAIDQAPPLSFRGLGELATRFS